MADEAQRRAVPDRASRCPLRPVSARVGPTRTQLQVLEKVVILSVRADPEPSDLVILEKPEGTESESHAHRVNGLPIVNLLEVKAWVAGVLSEQPIRLPSESSNIGW